MRWLGCEQKMQVAGLVRKKDSSEVMAGGLLLYDRPMFDEEQLPAVVQSSGTHMIGSTQV